MDIRHYSRGQRLALSACTDCRLCVDVCPAVSAAGDGRLSGAYRVGGLRRLLLLRSGPVARLLGRKTPSIEQMDAFSRTVFRCTLCAGCQEVCPVGLDLRDLWCTLRRDLVLSGRYPEAVDHIRENLVHTHNVFGEDNAERGDWVEDLPEAPRDGFLKDRADVVYFTGCVAAFYPLAQKIPMALARIFTRLGVDFTLLGEQEHCCGFPLLGAGLREEAGALMAHNTAAVLEKGASTVVFACPSCYQMWREHYPKTVATAHVTEFMDGLLRRSADRLNPVPLKVTYHDPCDLGRGGRVFEAPRRVLRAIPGVELLELPNNREKCRCCGGGGNLEMLDPVLSAAITRDKIDSVLSTGAQAVVTACQQCVRTMTTYVRRNDLPLEVMDITQLVERSLRPHSPADE